MLAFFVLALLFTGSHALTQPNPPTWPANIYVFKPGDSNIQQVVNKVYAENGGQSPDDHGQWSNSRYAFLFTPGSYANIDVFLGYYTSLVGVGQSPSDVTIGNVMVEDGSLENTNGALSDFWRSAEGFRSSPTKTWFGNSNAMLWAVSQAAPLRRAVINGALLLFEYISGDIAGYASGGYLADVSVSGKVTPGSQQQFFFRNAHFGQWDGGVWNMVFSGCTGQSSSHCGNQGGAPMTEVARTPVIAEKPYIVYNNGKYSIFVPALKFNSVGPTTDYNAGTRIDFADVLVATDKTPIATINAALAAGQHLVLCGGNYALSSPITVTKANTVILGVGFPVLASANGNPVITVESGIAGVKIAAVLMQAGRTRSATLLRWGAATNSSVDKGNPSNPGFLYDSFARVGGTNDPNQYQVSVDVMVQINSGNVVIDNTWYWRADHGVSGLVRNSQNPVANGLQYWGDNGIAYGLAVEHTLGDLVQWYGNNGTVIFYQSEYPYDATQANYGDRGYAAYHVMDTAKSHRGYGIGVYSYWRDSAVNVATGIKTPSGSAFHFENSLCVWLNGQGSIQHIVNGQGNACQGPGGGTVQYLCKYN